MITNNPPTKFTNPWQYAAMFFLPALKNERPSTPVPSFILTDTSSTFDNTASLTGTTKLTRSLDSRLSKLKLSLGEHHPDIVCTLSAIGDASLQNGDYDPAMQYYTQALDGAKHCFPAGHPKTADILCSIGNTSMKLKMYGECKSNFNAALKIYRSAVTDRSWKSDADGMMQKVEFELQHKIASTVASLGSVAFAEKNYSASNIIFQDALLEAKRAAVSGVALDRIKPSNKSSSLKEARIFVSEMFNNIASVSAEQGDKAAAIKNYNNALALQIQEMGEDHYSVACTLHNIGTMHYRSGEYQLALKSYKQVLKMRRYLFSNDDIRIAEVLLNIGAVHERADEIERSVSAISAAYRISSRHYGERSVPCADINASLGSLYARTGGCDGLALDYYDTALEIYKLEGLTNSDQSVKSVLQSINFIKKKGQGQAQVQTEQESGFVSATEAWLTLFGNYCGSMCIPDNSNDGPWIGPNLTTSPLIQSHNLANSTTVTV